jgi:hypothetical protein
MRGSVRRLWIDDDKVWSVFEADNGEGCFLNYTKLYKYVSQVIVR